MRFRRRALVAVAEALAVIVLAWLAWWCWHRGVIITVRNGVALRRIEGPWWAAATAAATLAGILVLDALRKVEWATPRWLCSTVRRARGVSQID